MASVALTPKQKSDAQKDIVQEAAVRKVVKHFKSHNRGQLAMFCGTGKTRTAIKAIKRLKSRVVVVCVPTLGLASQWINDFAKYGDKRELLAVCSKLHNETPEDYGIVGYTTNKDVVRAFARSKGKLLIVSTYQSYDVIQAAWRRTKLAPIDLLIADEAHNTAGKNSKHMGLCLHDSGAKVVKRLFMTATRRLYRGDKDDYNCMDDTEVYGDVIYELTLREAIDRGIVSDYAVYVINVYKDLRPEDFANINSRGFESELLAKFVSEKIMNEKAVRVFTFHNRVADAEEFAQHVEASGKWAKVLTGEHKVKDRESVLRTFESHDKSSLVASVNVLGEGIDVPSVDVIVFADKMTEPQAIIQRMGRGTRMVEGKGKLKIILPICVSPKMTDGEVLSEVDESQHKDALNVIRAMASYDPRFYREVEKIEREHRNKSDSQGGVCALTEDKMLLFDMDESHWLSVRLLPNLPWPSKDDGVMQIECAIRHMFSETGRIPKKDDSSEFCPKVFKHWTAVDGFLKAITGESLAKMCFRLNGHGNYPEGRMGNVVKAFELFIGQHARYPLPGDGGEMAPLSFKNWREVCEFLSNRGTSLSKMAAERGLNARGVLPDYSTEEIYDLAQVQITRHIGQFNRLPCKGDKFLFGKSFSWFQLAYPDINSRLREIYGKKFGTTEEDVIKAIVEFVKNNKGKSPSRDDLPHEGGWCSARKIKWADMQKLAGIEPTLMSRENIRVQSIVEDVRKFIDATGRMPDKNELKSQRKFIYVHKPFGISSWLEFVKHVTGIDVSVDIKEKSFQDKLSAVISDVHSFVSTNNTRPCGYKMSPQYQWVRKHKPYGISVWSAFVDHVLSMHSPQKAAK